MNHIVQCEQDGINTKYSIPLTLNLLWTGSKKEIIAKDGYAKIHDKEY